MTVRPADILIDIYRRTLEQVRPGKLLARHVCRQGDDLYVGGHRLSCERVWLLGAGKASLTMARALSLILGENLVGGVLIAPSGAAMELPPCLEIHHGEHPLPGRGSYRGAQRILHCAREIPRQDSLLFLLSGGASSLMELPRPGLSLAQIRDLYAALLHCGAPICDVNRIRQAYSHIKGGGLLPHLPPHTVTLILSDVLDHPLSVVGSGPTMRPEEGPPLDELLARYHLSGGPARHWASPPPSQAPVPPHVLIGDVTSLLEAARRVAIDMNLEVEYYPELLRGEARRAGANLAQYWQDRRRQGRVLLAAGECTVEVRGSGRGGRCQELALGFALASAGGDMTLLAAGSDGKDGVSPAAGAWADGQSVDRGLALGLDLEEALQQNDAYPCLEALEQILPENSTGTNLNDMVLLL